MGLLKKIFKPVAKVLDKIVPNEIKPALPYLAAFAPVFGPTAGMFGSTMGKRMLLSGGANILGQLSQEGSEGDINLLSAGLGALTGAMTAPDAASKFASMKTPTGSFKDVITDTVIKRPELSFLDQAKNVGLEGLAKGADIFAKGAADPFSMEGLKAAALPAATATGDVMEASARQLEKQNAIDEALAAAEALADSGSRADAIRNAMLAYGFFSEDEIADTIASAGYRAGGRVGFKNAGIASLEPGQMDTESSKESSYEIDNKPIILKFYSKEDSGRRNEAFYEIINPLTGNKSNISQEDYIEKYGEPKAKGGRVGFRFGGIDEAIESVQEETIEKGKDGIMTAAKEDPLLLEEYNKYVFDLMEQRPDAKPMSFSDFKRMIMSGMKTGGRVKAEEGGLMDLGGKEMDLRGGGFVPIGKKEKADDVPARLSKNEFVMTADAVRAAGGGSVNEGAKRMYETMNKLEARA
jgi:hypothetical protein